MAVVLANAKRDEIDEQGIELWGEGAELVVLNSIDETRVRVSFRDDLRVVPKEGIRLVGSPVLRCHPPIVYFPPLHCHNHHVSCLNLAIRMQIAIRCYSDSWMVGSQMTRAAGSCTCPSTDFRWRGVAQHMQHCMTLLYYVRTSYAYQ